MSSMDLAEFLLARIADDEAVARAAGGQVWHALDYEFEGIAVHNWSDDHEPPGDRTAQTDQITRWSPARVLAECEAKRRIVDGVDVLTGGEKTYAQRMHHTDAEDDRYVIARDMLRALALSYAEHPDYREEWR